MDKELLEKNDKKTATDGDVVDEETERRGLDEGAWENRIERILFERRKAALVEISLMMMVGLTLSKCGTLRTRARVCSLLRVQFGHPRKDYVFYCPTAE